MGLKPFRNLFRVALYPFSLSLPCIFFSSSKNSLKRASCIISYCFHFSFFLSFWGWTSCCCCCCCCWTGWHSWMRYLSDPCRTAEENFVKFFFQKSFFLSTFDHAAQSNKPLRNLVKRLVPITLPFLRVL